MSEIIAKRIVKERRDLKKGLREEQLSRKEIYVNNISTNCDVGVGDLICNFLNVREDECQRQERMVREGYNDKWLDRLRRRN